jgi:prepilin-type N-terminal cleavage/methylation domain-containing protein
MKKRRAFTLIEMLIAVAVIAMLAGLVASAINQTMSVNASSGARTEAIKQLDVAIDTLRRDIQMAQQVEAPSASGFPLNLGWREWNNTRYSITYSMLGSQLKRQVVIDGGEPRESVLAAAISQIQVNNLPYRSGSLSISITATVGGLKQASESRTFQVFPRAGT